MTPFLKFTVLCTFLYLFFLIARYFLEGEENTEFFSTINKILLAGLGLSVVATGIYQAFFTSVSFANPMLLLLLIPVLIFAGAYPYLQKYRPALNYNLAYATNTATAKSALAKYFCFALNITAVCLLIAALARPRNIDRTIVPPLEGVEIMLTLDTSISMTTPDFQPNRMEAAKAAAAEFIKKRSADKIGLVVFGGSAMLVSPLTLDYDSLLDYLSTIYSGIMRDNGTAVGDALATAVLHLQNSKSKSKIIILLTDGASNTGAITPPLAAETAKAYGIKVYTIATMGINATEEFDEGLLRQIAADTNAKFFRAYDAQGLNQIYSEIDKLEKTEFEQSVTISYKDRYRAPLIFALMLLAFSFLFDKFVFVRIP